MKIRTFLMMMAAIFTAEVYAIQTTYIDVDAVVTNSPTPQVTFTWDSQADWATIEVARREMGTLGGSATWVARASLGYPTSTFADVIDVGTTYEYRIRRPYNASYSTYKEVASFVAVSLDAPLVSDRGELLLVVDQTVTNALSGELRQLELDLCGDGWTVRRLDFARDGSGTPDSLRTAITNAYVASGGALKALYLFGHLPVAKSGYLAPDGHALNPQHADGFYGDVNGAWTDSTRYAPGVNIPGDGIYDQDYFPSPVDLMVGRVDFATLPAMHKQEIEYLRDYIHKSHAFRHGRRTEVPRRGLWNSGYLWPERSWINPLFGRANVTYAPFQPTLDTTPHLFGIDFGVAGGNSAEYVEKANKLIFGINFGSGKLYWNNYNNAMRALLAQPDWGLTCVWGARPSWFFHHMGAGLPVGYSSMRTMNNNKGGSSSGPSYDYFPTGDYANMAGYVGESLMGDPTLRLHPVAPPESVAVEKQGAAAVLIWEPSPDAAVSAYHVYSSTNRLGPYTRLTAAPIASLTFTHVVPPASDVYYQVCAVKRELTPATVYTNASQGVFAQLDADGTANWAPTADGTNLATSVDQFLSIPLGGTDPDGDALTPVVTRNPTNGELRWNGTQVVYVPKIGYSGDDSVRYAMSDGVTLSAPAIVDIVVSPNRNLIEWEFGSPLNTVPQNLGSTTNATGILPATVTLGSALSLSTDLAIFQNDAICLSGTPVGGLNSNGYLEWIVAPETLHRMSLSRVSLGLWNNDSAKPLSAELRWSDDGFSTWQTIPLGSEPATYAGNYYDDNAGMPFTGSLADVDELQNLTHAVTFRLYVWHGTSSSVCGIGKLGAVRTDLAIAGSVLSIAPPVVTSAAQAEGRLGEPFEYTITADNDPTGFGASGLPSWASIDSGTGVISGTPDAAGVSPVLLSATNAWGTGTASLEIVVGCVIEATSGEGGMIAPSGRIGVAEGASQAFAITPGPYALIGDVLVDGVSVGAVAQYTFADVQSNHTIHAEFAELLTTHGTPYAWLADLGYTGDFEAADLDDLDGDGVPNWIEHRDETDPADPLSRPAYNTVPYAEAFENLAGWGRVHTNVVGRMGWSSDIGAADHSRIVPAAYAYAAGTPPLPAATHTNVLELETSGGALSCDFGEGFTMAGGMAYVDLLAQAARCEATPEQYGPGDVGSKAGAYVDAEGWICVHHGVAAPDGSWLSNAVSRTAFQVGAEDWFRLTVAIDATLGAGHPTMFQARVNGVVVTNGAAYAEGWKEAYLGTGMLPAPSAEGSWFRTATADAAETLLRAVAFTGNGSVDDLVVGTADPFAAGPGTCLLVVRRSGNGTTSLGGSELASVEVPFGSATQVVYAAADWHRIASLETDGAAVPAASGLAVHTQVFASVTANVSNDVAFALATPEQTGHANVPTAWLANWTEAAVAAAPADGYDVEAKYLLGLDPTASNTYALAVESLELRGPEAVAVARRHVTGPLSPDGMHGNLVLQHAGDLGAGFTNLPGATVTGPEAFDGEGRRAFTNAIPEGAATGFFRAAVQPGE